jgi:hypothetical protein
MKLTFCDVKMNMDAAIIGNIVYFNYKIHWLSAAKILNMRRDTNKQ